MSYNTSLYFISFKTESVTYFQFTWHKLTIIVDNKSQLIPQFEFFDGTDITF